MKEIVGILSIPRADNYGSVLQCYALQNALKKIEIKNEIIDYVSPFLVGRYKIWNTDYSSVKAWLRSNLKSFLVLRKAITRKKKFQEFRNQYMTFSEKTVYDKKDIDRYSMIICGSDQIWNTRITRKDSAFFLDFVDENTKKFAYAVSLGYADRSDAEVAFYKKYITGFSYIGVRESMDVSFVRKCVQKDVQVKHVLDPTLMLEKMEWKRFLNGERKRGNYILAFIFQDDENAILAAKKLSDKMGLPVYIIGQGVRKYNRDNFRVMSGVGPIEWLNLFNEAKFIVTNSFHGTAFSIEFEKQFVSIPYHGTENRMLSLLSLLGLEDRIFDGYFKFHDAIDYKKVREKLSRARKESYDFLKMAMREDGK